MSIAFLIARLLVGLGMAAHGSQKLFGWFGGGGIAGTGGYFAGLGFRPGILFAIVAGLAELGSGLLIVFGVGSAIGPALLIMVMVVAILTVHAPKGYFNGQGGYELNATLIAVALMFAFAGFGRFSLDHALGLHLVNGVRETWIAILVAAIVGFLNTLARRPVREGSSPG